MTRLIVIAAAALAASVIAGPALAVPPEEIDFQWSDETFQAGDVCSFQVSLTIVEQKTRAKLFFDREGNVERLQVTGTMLVTLRNDETGEAITVRNAGMGRYLGDFDEGFTQVDAGRHLWWIFAGEPGGPALFIAHGRTTVTFGPGFVLTSLETTGPRDDLCAVLAGD